MPRTRAEDFRNQGPSSGTRLASGGNRMRPGPRLRSLPTGARIPGPAGEAFDFPPGFSHRTRLPTTHFTDGVPLSFHTRFSYRGGPQRNVHPPFQGETPEILLSPALPGRRAVWGKRTPASQPESAGRGAPLPPALSPHGPGFAHPVCLAKSPQPGRTQRRPL